MGKLNTKLIFGIFLILLVGLIIADDIAKVDPGSENEEKVDKDKECRYVNVGSDADYAVMVPSGSNSEWHDFRSNYPDEVSLGDCCGDGDVDSDEECDGGSKSCEECCHTWGCDGHGHCERTTEHCEDGTKDCQDDCTWGYCDASPSCTHYCDSDADCFG